MLTTLTLACIETAQGFSIAAFEDWSAPLAESVQRDLDSITTTP